MKSKLPLIRLSAVNPLLLELQKRHCDVSSLLQQFDLPTNVPASAELFAAADTIYEVVEQCGATSGDSLFGFSVGSALSIEDWGVMSLPASRSKTVGELLTQISLHTSEHSSSTDYYLKTQGGTSSFGFRRAIRPRCRPAHNDAFYFGLLLRLLKFSVRENWDASRVLFRVAAPEHVPKDVSGCRVVEGDWLGVAVTFPTEWLFEPFDSGQPGDQPAESGAKGVPRSLVDSIRAALRPHLHDEHLTAEKASRLCGFERRRLAKELRDHGTTISKELALVRAECAGAALVSSDRPVADIAAEVGFSDPNVFSRAFKKWTGQSPRAYRRHHKSPD